MNLLTRRNWIVGVLAVAVVAVVTWSLASGPATPHATDPDAVAPLVKRGFLAMQQREEDPAALDRALADFERAYKLDPDHYDARFGLAWARQIKGLPMSEWGWLYERTIDDAALLTYLSAFNLGNAERRAGRHDEAIKLLERAVQVMPDRRDGWLELARCYKAAGRRADTARATTRADAARDMP